MFAQVFNFTPLGSSKMYYFNYLNVFLYQSIVYSVIFLFLFLIFSVSLYNVYLKFHKFSPLYNFIKNINTVIIGFIFLLIFVKFMVYLWNYKLYSFYLTYFNITSIKLNYVYTTPVISLNGSILSDAIVLLAFSSGLVCIYLLGEKNIAKYLSNINLFSMFLVAIIIMVYTTNLLVMFLGFECLFIPTLYFVYKHGYVERADRTLRVLLYWTLTGAFLVLTTLSYIFYKYKTLTYYVLVSTEFTSWENYILYTALFLGFGVKVPIFPFHYWLTKIHVEAPAGFSIFLSGFLVKAAIYCFYYFNLIFQTTYTISLVTFVAIFGILDASVKMWNQTDFKKLIAFATIQEMNLILFFLGNFQSLLDYSIVLFILVHGWLSTLMFFLVDIIQKKLSSRNILEISGLAYTFPGVRLVTWLVILLFSGFPLTIKFIVEWQILSIYALYNHKFMVFCLLVIIVIGIAGFVKQMIIILYGMPRNNYKASYTLLKRDKYLFYLITFVLSFLHILDFFLS